MPPAGDIAKSPAAVLEGLLTALPEDHVSLGWLHAQMREHSFEMLAFILAIMGALPGASVVIGVLMIVPAAGMMFSLDVELPSLLASRSIPARHASFIIGRAIPFLRGRETREQTRHAHVWKFARPVIGLLTLLLGVTLLVPVPLSNVIPAFAIAGLALASFEGNFALLCISVFTSAGWLVLTAVTAMAASQAFAHIGF